MTHKTHFLYLCLFVAIGVFGVVKDEVKSVSVMEGDSVTLHTDITQIQKDDNLVWLFESQSTRIAEIFMQMIKIHDGLQLNNRTGSLTITNITITDSGLYKLKVFSNRGTSYKRFNVTVSGLLPAPVISSNSSNCSSLSSSSKCMLLCSVLNVRDVSLSWYKGNSLLSSISVSDLNIRLSLPLEVDYQDNNTYRCVLNNLITNQTQHLNITHLCQPCPELSQHSNLILIVVVLLLVAIVGAVGVIYCFYHPKRPAKVNAYVQKKPSK
ncbi:uncharacterized protein [Misgurnus anguillicaudatus]|uniref:uncharacterized protein n=1 Tax=Misgurnus anguillicaudatus TaxID=75329 RepID=UPI003CCFAF63